MDSNSTKQIKKLLTEMFTNHYKKMCKMSHAHKKSLNEMTEANNKVVNKKNLRNYLQKHNLIQTIPSMLTTKSKDLKESLTVNQDLIDDKIYSINDKLNIMKKR